MKWLFRNPGYKLLALAIALLLWGLSHGTVSVERGLDLPLEFSAVPSDLVVTGQSSDAVNIRVRGSRAAIRALSGADLSYRVDLSGAKAGTTEREVDPASQLDLPRGVQIVSRSPSTLEIELEPFASRSVAVRPDLDGEPAEGFRVEKVEVEPARVRIAGARSEVLRFSEVLTETVDLQGATEALERQVRVVVGGRNVWLEGPSEVRVRAEVSSLEAQAEEEGRKG